MKKIFNLIVIFLIVIFLCPVKGQAGTASYPLKINFSNTLDVDILSFQVNGEDWEEWDTGTNNTFSSGDDKYQIIISYVNSTGLNPVVLFDDLWDGKIEQTIMCPKGCFIMEITIDNSEHNELLDLNFTSGYNVSFETNGGSAIDNTFVEINNKIVKPTNPTKPDYAFDGWYIDDSLKKPFDFDTIITADTTLYAKWALLHNVTVTVNDQSMGVASANYTSAIKGTQISLTATPNNGYHFVKWESEDVDASTGKFEMIDKDISVKAIFEKDEVKTYKVSFNANGGSGTMSDVTGLTGTYKLLANEFTAPAGKQFKGWSLSSDGVIITELDMTEDKTVYAIWEDIPKEYDYEIIKGDNQTLIIDKFDEFTFTINGDYSLFVSVKIGNLELVRDADYIVTEGSTIITFTKSGIEKLNSLENGEYEIIVNYSNDKIATGSLYVNKENPVEPSDLEDEPDVEPDKKKDEQKEIPEENPETSDNVGIYLTVGSISFISLIGCVIYTKRKRLRA